MSEVKEIVQYDDGFGGKHDSKEDAERANLARRAAKAADVGGVEQHFAKGVYLLLSQGWKIEPPKK